MLTVPGSKFNGQIAPALLDLVERDLLCVLDLLVLKKDADGSLEPLELSDLDEAEIGGCGRTSRTGETTAGTVTLERTRRSRACHGRRCLRRRSTSSTRRPLKRLDYGTHRSGGIL